ncbi:hypothetical protein ANAPRD1_00160 [Anaplasma phagocytophilum]|nr:hypothetical protein ANAPRD1_00160 [Anaplasma phagocytophilum]
MCLCVCVFVCLCVCVFVCLCESGLILQPIACISIRASIGSLYVKASIKKLFRAYEVQVLKLRKQ